MFSKEYALSVVFVKGEISNCKYHSSGHIYFSLKDDRSQLTCVMFRGDRGGLDFRMENGQEVVVGGSISVYERDGKYQLYAKKIVPVGDGHLQEQYEKLKKNSDEDREFKNIEDMQHVRIQCEQIAESSKYIAELKKESLEVQKYIDDIQNIENCPENLRKKITDIAEKTEKLEKKCYDIHSREQNLSRERTAMFVRYENEFPKALVNLQNDEKYFQAVKHDMRMLEAEKISLKEDMKMYQDRTGKVKNGAVIFLFVILVIFVLFFVSGQLNNAGGRNLFFALLFNVAGSHYFSCAEKFTLPVQVM